MKAGGSAQQQLGRSHSKQGDALHKKVDVGISDLKCSADPNAVIATYGLGSCIAVIAYDFLRSMGGILHYALPNSSINEKKAKEQPAMFADTGVPLLFQHMYALGSKKETLLIKVAGGGNLHNDFNVFQIGRRNYIVLRKLFSKNGILIAAEDVGDCKSRTVRLHVGTGKVTVSSQGTEVEL